MVVNVCFIFSCFLCGVNNGSTQVFADEVIDDTYKAKDFIGKGIDLSANHVIDTDHCVNYSIFSSNIEEIYYSNYKTNFHQQFILIIIIQTCLNQWLLI